MIPGLTNQAREFLISGALGLGLGLCYDWGRVHRRVFRGLTVPVDILFSLVFFLCLMLTAIYARGLMLYHVFGMFLGGCLYFLLLSPWLLRPLLLLLLKIRGLRKMVNNRKKKIQNFLRKLQKKLFSSSGKWSTIGMIPFSPKGKSLRKRGADPGVKKRSRKGSGRDDGGLGRVESGPVGAGYSSGCR